MVSRAWRIGLGTRVVLVATGAVALWLFVLHSRNGQMASFRLNTVARALAVYMSEIGAWPRSPTDLEEAGIFEAVAPGTYRFVAAKEEYPHLEPPLEVTVNFNQVPVGWGGVPIDETGKLIGMTGWYRNELDARARHLSGWLREVAADRNERSDDGGDQQCAPASELRSRGEKRKRGGEDG